MIESNFFDPLDPSIRCSPQAEKLLDHIGVILWNADSKSTRFTYVGPQAEKVFGYERNAWYEADFWLSHIHPDDRTKALSSRTMAQVQPTEVHVDYRFLKSNGQYIEVLDCVSSSQLSAEGSAVLSGVMVDVSHRKQVESLLAGQRRVLEILAGGASREETLTELVRVVEQQSQDMRCSILTLEPEGTYFKTCTAPSLPNAFAEYVVGMRVGPNSGPCGVAAFRKETVVVEDIVNDSSWEACKDFAMKTGLKACWSAPIFSEQNKVIGTFAMYFHESRLPTLSELQVANDTTNLARVIIEHTSIRDSLQQTISLLHATIESTTDGILVVDRFGKIVSFNQQFARLWKIPTAITESRDDARALAYVIDQLKDPHGFLETVQQLYNQPEVESFDVFEFKDGKIFERYSKAQKIGSAIVGRVWSFRDVTERRKAEREAEAANRAKMHFLANISHEIRTPLGAILGYSDLMATPGQTPEELREWEHNIKTNGAHLLQVVDEILDLSKCEFGKLSTDPAEFPLPEFILEVEQTFSMKAKAKGLHLKFTSEGPIPLHICSDRKILKQILLNVVGNAIKFTEHGEVSLKTKYLGPSTLVFEVRDTGVGIQATKRQFLFRPFEQADDSYTRKFGGSGIGLALAKRFANSLGGDVVLLESEAGRGSTFIITIDVSQTHKIRFTDSLYDSDLSSARNLEANQDNAFSMIYRSEPAPEFTNAKVLVIEDLAETRLLISKFLTALGAEAELVSNAIEGVEKAFMNHYDLILMDIQMPMKDGYQATRELRARGYQGPIVAITAHAMPEEQQLTKEAGCNGILIKPATRQLLAETLKRFVPVAREPDRSPQL